ncbi:rhamnose-binding lectin-like isoform X1 [Silurus meridionalis]|nr:rhamnose-binding lectin-like isoform X1 [Silurus meridionalis]
MVLLKFTLLTLFITALDLHVSGKTAITCDRNVLDLTCATGVIQVKSSVYGRTSRKACTFNCTASHFDSTNCVFRTFTIADRCDGLRHCNLRTDLLTIPDPCPGTYKYYNTTYNCIPGQVVLICEQEHRTLSCGDNAIQIINAIYGRADSTTCSNGATTCVTKNTNCYAPRTRAIVASLCNGQRSCTLEASNQVFTDPCVGTSKYLTVSYRCFSVPWHCPRQATKTLEQHKGLHIHT